MKTTFLTLTVSALLITGCSTTTKSPVQQDFKSQLKFSSVDVTFHPDREVPKAYDNVVRFMVDGRMGNRAYIPSFMAYVEANGGAGVDDETLGERYLEYRIEENLNSGLKGRMNGSRSVNLDVDIDGIVTPDIASTYFLGEQKGIYYDLKVKDTNTDETLLEYIQSSKPFVERSTGGSRGLLGLAKRSGDSTLLTDLDLMIETVVIEIKQVLTSDEVNKTVAKKIRVSEN